MSLLAHNEISLLLDDGVVTHAKREHINSASLDIQLGNTILIERTDVKLYQQGDLKRISLRDREQLTTIEWDLEREGPYIIYPGEFILAHSVEIFNLPNNISAEYKLKSSMARIGLDHLNAGWCDAGWHGSVLTLELKNCTRNHEIIIRAGDMIGQMIFFSHEEVPEGKSYADRGRYNNDKTVSGAKTKNKAIIYGEQAQEEFQAEFERTHLPEDGNDMPPRRVLDISEVRDIIEQQGEEKQ